MRLLSTLLLLLTFGFAMGRPPTPPTQAEHGPGSSDYYARGTIYTKYQEGYLTYWIITPDDPKPMTAPIAVFLPDLSQSDPGVYKSWIDHLVRRGFIVIFVVLPNQVDIPQEDFLLQVSQTLAAAQKVLVENISIKTAWNLLLFIGHGSGAVIAFDLACLKTGNSLNRPKALLLVQPYRQIGGARSKPLELGDVSALPQDCSVLMVTGSDDDINRDDDARLIHQVLTAQLPPVQLNSVTIRSDRHGNPPLVADQSFPYAKPGDRGKMRTDSLDWLGLWKLTDRLTDSAFLGNPLNLASDDLLLGKWSDGLLVNAMILNTAR